MAKAFPVLGFAAALIATASSEAQLSDSAEADVIDALAGDDQCQGASHCAVNALQLRGKKLEETAGMEHNASGMWQDCFETDTYYQEAPHVYTMAGTSRVKAANADDCQSRCAAQPGCAHFTFWPDGGCLFTSSSASSKSHHGVVAGPSTCSASSAEAEPDEPQPLDPTLQEPLGLPPFKVKQSSGCGGLIPDYKLSWEASGHSFFDNFTFVTDDETHGANQYLGKSAAFREGVVSTGSHATIRVGQRMSHHLKRPSVNLHSNQAWRPDKGFVLAMKYKHLPYGAGVWPALWLMNSDEEWPNGGEMDILEYANDARNKVTLHTKKHCMLDNRKLGKCMRSHFHKMGGPGPSDCRTNYFKNLLGCRPRQVQNTGEWYSSRPGVIAGVWDSSGVSVYHIPEAEIPADLHNSKPEPRGWDRWRTAFLPFDSRTCYDMAKPQEIVLNVALCGDWAGGAWARSPSARRTGFMAPRCKPGALSQPNVDCCTQWVASPLSDVTFRSTAYFGIDYIKVFEPSDEELSKYSSGTYRRGGAPIKA